MSTQLLGNSELPAAPSQEVFEQVEVGQAFSVAGGEGVGEFPEIKHEQTRHPVVAGTSKKVAKPKALQDKSISRDTDGEPREVVPEHARGGTPTGETGRRISKPTKNIVQDKASPETEGIAEYSSRIGKPKSAPDKPTISKPSSVLESPNPADVLESPTAAEEPSGQSMWNLPRSGTADSISSFGSTTSKNESLPTGGATPGKGRGRGRRRSAAYIPREPPITNDPAALATDEALQATSPQPETSELDTYKTKLPDNSTKSNRDESKASRVEHNGSYPPTATISRVQESTLNQAHESKGSKIQDNTLIKAQEPPKASRDQKGFGGHEGSVAAEIADADINSMMPEGVAELDVSEEENLQHPHASLSMSNIAIKYGSLFIAQALVVFACFALDRYCGDDARFVVDECSDNLSKVRTCNERLKVALHQRCTAMLAEINIVNAEVREGLLGNCTADPPTCASDNTLRCQDIAARFGQIAPFDNVVIILWAKFASNVAWCYSIAYYFLKKHPATLVFYMLNAVLIAAIFVSTPSGSKERITALPLLIMGTEVVCVGMVIGDVMHMSGSFYLPFRCYVMACVDLGVGAILSYLAWLLALQPIEYHEQRDKAHDLLLAIRGLAGLVSLIYIGTCWFIEDLRSQPIDRKLAVHHYSLAKFERCVFYGFVYVATVSAFLRHAVSPVTAFNVIFSSAGFVACFRLFTFLWCFPSTSNLALGRLLHDVEEDEENVDVQDPTR